MTGFTRRPLAVIVCCLFAGMQTSHAAPAIPELGRGLAGLDDEKPADAQVVLLAENDLPVKLRMERKFNVLGKKAPATVSVPGIEHPVALRKDDSYPMFVIADSIEGQTDEMTEADGNVELRKAGQLLFADHVTHRPLDDEIEANGNVRLLQDGSEIRTPHLRLKVSEQIGYTEAAEYQIVRQVTNRYYQQQQAVVTVSTSNSTVSNAPMMLNVPNSYGLPTVVPLRRPSEASGRAERIDFEGENQVSLSKATYSTCKPDREDWYLQAEKMHLDYDRDVGESKHASLWFKDIPLFYWPVGSFSLNGQPRSGFLHPWFSASTKNGLDVAAPYYWSIAPNYDMTLYPRYMSKRGLQLGSEARYLDQYSRGQLRLEYMPEDRIEKRERHAFTLQHQQVFGRGFSGVINWNEVSDDFYWSDMSSRLLQTSQVQLPQQMVLNYAPVSGFQSSVQWLRYQTLQTDSANSVVRPYFLEPQLNVAIFRPDVLNTDVSFAGQFSRFTHPTQTNGDRLVLYPQVSVPFVTPAFQITPKLGLHMTSYALSQQTSGEPSTINRTLPIFSIDSSLIFERETTLGEHPFIQTLEPRLYYVNIPYRDQSNIPLFDTGLSDFNFAQIFSENRYSGYDRINDANQLTAAVTTRFLDANTGAERFKAMLGQRYYFSQQRVTLPSETKRPDNFSNLVAAATGLVGPRLYADAAWEFNYREGYNQTLSAGLRFQPDFGKVLSGSYRYNRDPVTGSSTVDQIDIAGQWPINGRWFVVGRYNFSIRDRRLLEAIAGFEYNAGCWMTRMVAQQLEATAGSANTTLFLQLELNDLGSIGTNPITMLRRSIPGYGKINELSNRSQLLSE